ncbi:MAG TPA: Stp1/IreP family PP2C-type Ser/Thr phosphatase [Acidobacteriaceae bacterium]|nr:Stp1/IreP family PP2C-type Ser/Thr phosphatase [Acidobacteriaceae bacterium]
MSVRNALKIDAFGISDVGCQRTNNEDSFSYDLASQLFVVCDGMGGMAAGELASGTAVQELLRSFTASDPGQPIEERLYDAIADANRSVFALAEGSAELKGMGTTLVAACVEGEKLVVANVGDSRAWFLRNGSCAQITHDHSFVAEQVRIGAMSPEQAGVSPLQSLLTRAIGQAEAVEPDIFTAPLEPGDILLLATDGLSRYADTDTIAGIVLNSATLEQACQALIECAKSQGAVDNVTCLLLQVIEGEPETSAP